MIIVDDVSQGSKKWFELRSGIPTASCFDKIITPKGSKSKQSEKYLYHLVGERLAGPQVNSYQSEAMLRGKEMESEAKQLFEIIYGVKVKEVGLIYQDEKKRHSISPDGLVLGTGLELKCPIISTHVMYLLDGKLPNDYIPQVQGSMLTLGVNEYYFMSYFPGLDPLILKVERDNDFCAELKILLDDFCEELDQITEKLRGK